MNISEISIPVPWGHVAAKAWGNEDDPPVLIFHGLIDNAGSFDRLIPHLPRSFRYVCFDLPGHGRSSHFPPFLPIITLNYITVYKLIVEYFKKDKYVMLGHSYGAQIASLFAQLYPEHVEKLIMLDAVHLIPTLVDHFKHALTDRLKLDERTGPRPTYTYEEALRKLQDHRFNGFLTPEGAASLLPRGLAPAGDGKFTFTVDFRLKNMINPLHDFPYILGTMKKFPVRCPLLIILARDNELQLLFMKPIINLLKEQENVEITFVDGHHDVHNNNPEIVAPYICKFLLRQQAKL